MVKPPLIEQCIPQIYFFFNTIYHVSAFTLVKYFGDVLVTSSKIIQFLSDGAIILFCMTII